MGPHDRTSGTTKGALMNWFRRLCLIVFSLAGLATLAALGLVWVGPWQSEAAGFLADPTYLACVEAAAGVTAVGLLVSLLRGVFSRSNRRSVVVSSLGGGTVTVTRAAIASQAAHIVADDGTCQADRVRVSIRGNKVRVRVRVLPFETVDVATRGAQLHDELMSGLARVCGDTIRRVDLEFVEPEQVTVEGAPEAAPGREAPAPEAPQGEAGTPQPAEQPATSEITVHMGPGSALAHAEQGAPHAEGAPTAQADDAPEGARAAARGEEAPAGTDDEGAVALGGAEEVEPHE